MNRRSYIKSHIVILVPPSWKLKNLSPGQSIRHLSWWEKCILVTDFHEYMQSAEGKPTGLRMENGWSLADTAKTIGISRPMVCLYIELREASMKYPEISRLSKMRKAMKYLEVVDGHRNG